MKMPKYFKWIAFVILTLLWIAFLGSEMAPGFFPCEAFADDLGFMSTKCSFENLITDMRVGDIQLHFMSYLVAVFVALGLPAGVFWRINRKK